MTSGRPSKADISFRAAVNAANETKMKEPIRSSFLAQSILHTELGYDGDYDPSENLHLTKDTTDRLLANGRQDAATAIFLLEAQYKKTRSLIITCTGLILLAIIATNAL